MKLWKILPAALALLLLCACSRFVDNSYTVVTSHTTGAAEADDSDYLTAESYEDLETAIKTFVQKGTVDGVIRSYRYDGQLEEDLAAATYELKQNNPVIAYCVEYFNYDCSLLVSYNEIHIHMAFRDTLTPIHQIEYVGSSAETTFLMEKALDTYDDHLTIYTTFAGNTDYAELAAAYCQKKLGSHAVRPSVSVISYPAEGFNRIDEILFTYGKERSELTEMDTALAECLQSAGVYARYSKTEMEKADLLFSFLSDRFQYQQGQTNSPVYSVFCEGIVDDEALSWAWQLLCQEVGIECWVVDGSFGGQSHLWNIMKLDGMYYHTDLLEPILTDGQMVLYYDETIPRDYSWSGTDYPACPEPETPAEEVTEELPEPEEEPAEQEQP